MNIKLFLSFAYILLYTNNDRFIDRLPLLALIQFPPDTWFDTELLFSQSFLGLLFRFMCEEDVFSRFVNMLGLGLGLGVDVNDASIRPNVLLDIQCWYNALLQTISSSCLFFYTWVNSCMSPALHLTIPAELWPLTRQRWGWWCPLPPFHVGEAVSPPVPNSGRWLSSRGFIS